jgi:DNA replicative helicase MCM subunit Mcm2 (Cdc46/Mcm family)
LKREGRERKHIPLPATLLNREDFDVPFVIEDDCEGEWVDVVEGEA